jgi:hypothetical protein
MDLTKKLNPNYAKNRVVFLDSKLEEIEYDTNQNQIPYLKVKGIALEHINAYRPGVFLESKIYRFYYHESNLSLLSIDDLSRPENQEF